ncbi:MAG: hypothetical protein JXA93_14300 [Anaerolineae bacterium]|nr:hypothetical protein [Anaerolineae bacterium]
MALSNMSSRERTIVIVLAVIIVIALLGIGILAARLMQGEEPDATASAAPPETITAIPPPSPGAPVATPVTNVGKPVAVTRAEGLGPGVPVMIVAQALHPGRRYRIEIAAADGASVQVNGNWSQGAVALQGQPAAPQIEFFEGVTPYQIEVVSPVPNPEMWSVSVSAGPKNILGAQPRLVITIWDVTEAE